MQRERDARAESRREFIRRVFGGTHLRNGERRLQADVEGDESHKGDVEKMGDVGHVRGQSKIKKPISKDSGFVHVCERTERIL